ncbi:MAG: hypothetical protein Q9165_005446 [Trypethelium subeluteriae]
MSIEEVGEPKIGGIRCTTSTVASGIETAGSKVKEDKPEIVQQHVFAPPDTSISRPRPSFLDGTLSNALIHVEIAEGQTFTVHKDLLCYCSPNFRAALEGEFIERIEGKLHLDDVDERTFKMFLEWLYFEKLPSWGIVDGTWSSTNANNEDEETEESTSESEGEFFSDRSESDLSEELRDLEGDDQVVHAINSKQCETLASHKHTSDERVLTPENFEAFFSMQPEAELVNLYIFADKYDVPGLRDVLITELRDHGPDEEEVPSFAVVIKAYDNLPADSPLCQYLMQVYLASYRAHSRYCLCDECGLRDMLPSEFLLTLMSLMSADLEGRHGSAQDAICEWYHQHADRKECQACGDRGQ